MGSRTILRAPSAIRDGGDVRFFVHPEGTADLIVDLSPVTWIAPVGVVALLALVYRARMDEGLETLAFVWPKDPAARRYLSAIGFVSELKRLGAVLPDNQGGANAQIRACLPVTLVTQESEMEEAANRLELTLMELRAPAAAVAAAYLVMTELANNAWQYGSPCYVVAQTHSGRSSGTPGVHVAIADFGKGFAESLAMYKPRDEIHAIEMAFEEGISGTGDPMRGFGLFHTARQVDNYRNAELCVVSNNAMMKRQSGKSEFYRGPDCEGVFVAAYFPFNPSPI